MTRLDVALLSLSQLVVGLVLAAALGSIAYCALQFHREGMARVRRAVERERLARLVWLPDPLPAGSMAAQMAHLSLCARLAADALARPYREAFGKLAAVFASSGTQVQQAFAGPPRATHLIDPADVPRCPDCGSAAWLDSRCLDCPTGTLPKAWWKP